MNALKSATLILGAAALAVPANAQCSRLPGFGHASMMYYAYEPEPYGQSFLGVDPDDITPDRRALLKLKKEDTGVEIRQVDQDAPAGKVGLKKYDVILAFNGIRVDSAEQLRRMIHETQPGRNVTLSISRDGQPITVTVQLVDYQKWVPEVARTRRIPLKADGFGDKMPEVDDFPEIQLPETPWPGYTSRAGMIVESLSSQLAEFLGAKDGKGVLVRSVEKGSAAAVAGIKAGDVILRIGNRTIGSRTDFRHQMDAYKSGKLNIVVLRDKQEQTIAITVPADQSRNAFPFDLQNLNLQGLDLQNLEAELRPLIDQAQSDSMQAAVNSMEATREEWAKRKGEFENQARAMQQMHEYWNAHQAEFQQEIDRALQTMQDQMRDLHLEFHHFD